MSKVIVGFDASEQSDDALVLGQTTRQGLRRRAPRRGRPAADPDPVRGGDRRADRSPPSWRSASTSRPSAGWREREFTRASLDGEVGGRSAARALYEYAEDQNADLIVVGSSHRGKLGRILPGSVGESLLRGAPCAVAVAPRGFARREHAGFGLIGIAYDGSEEADLALKQAERLSSSLECRAARDHGCAHPDHLADAGLPRG